MFTDNEGNDGSIVILDSKDIYFGNCSFVNFTAQINFDGEEGISYHSSAKEGGKWDLEELNMLKMMQLDEYHLFDNLGDLGGSHCKELFQEVKFILPTNYLNINYQFKGGLFINNCENVTIENSLFTLTSGDIPIINAFQTSISFNHVQFTDNFSTASELMLFNRSLVTFSNCLFVNNSNVENPILYALYSDMIFDKCEFINNTILVNEYLHPIVRQFVEILFNSTENVGNNDFQRRNKLMRELYDSLKLEDSWNGREYDGRGSYQGGEAIMDRSLLKYIFTHFTYPFQRENALLFFNLTNCEIQHSTFQWNFGYYGGCLYYNDIYFNTTYSATGNTTGDITVTMLANNNLLTVNQSSFIQNAASRGSAISIRTLSNYTINQYSIGGGANALNDSKIIIENTLFRDNVAVTGGCIYLVNHPFTNVFENFISQHSADDGESINASPGFSSSSELHRNRIMHRNAGRRLLHSNYLDYQLTMKDFHGIDVMNWYEYPESDWSEFNKKDLKEGIDIREWNEWNRLHNQFPEEEEEEEEEEGGGGGERGKEGSEYIGNRYIQEEEGEEGEILEYILRLDNATFTSNLAAESGSCVNSYSISFSMKNSSFNDNQSFFRGGAIYQGNATHSRIENTLFNHTTSQRGAAIYSKSDIIILNCIFSNNQVDTGEGSALYITETALIELNSTVFLNNTSNNVGCIFAKEYSILHFHDVLFSRNYAKVQGSSIVAGDNSMIYMENTLFQEDSAKEFGGCIYLTDNNHSEFVNVSIIHSSTGGGMIHQAGSSYLLLQDSALLHNTAIQSGGALLLRQNSACYIYRSHIFNNTAFVFGGAIFIFDFANLTIENSLVESNLAIGGGGGICASDNSFLVIHNSILRENYSQKGGGGLLLRGKVEFTGIMANFTGNKTPDQGGALFVEDNSEFRLHECIMEYNHAGTIGGAILMNSFSRSNISNSYISHNQAYSRGGGIVLQSTSNLLLYNTLFNNNNSTGGGLAILQDTSIFTCINCSFAFNNSTTEAGAIILSDSNRSFLIDSLFYANNCSLGIGGCMSIDSNTFSHFYFVNFTANFAQSAAALFVRGTAIAYTNNCLFNDNISLLNGGSIITADYSTPTFSFTFFYNNTAGSFGSYLLPSLSLSLFTLYSSSYLSSLFPLYPSSPLFLFPLPYLFLIPLLLSLFSPPSTLSFLFLISSSWPSLLPSCSLMLFLSPSFVFFFMLCPFPLPCPSPICIK